MDESIKQFVAKAGAFKLKDHDPGYKGNYSKDQAGDLLEEYKEAMEELQEKLYASNSYSVLLIFQAMDAAGKDSAIKHVMSGLNPQGTQVFSFKQPSAEEYDHDFLWRHYKALPEKGRIGIHNRSHYENVLVCKVHPELVLKENIPGISSTEQLDDRFWKQRYESIKGFEEHLTRNGTLIFKFFLNVSRKEQKERFLERINDPLKNWKFSAFDVNEREHWNEYMEAYEEAINRTSTEDAPWYIIPADHKYITRMLIGQIIKTRLEQLQLNMPSLSDADMEGLKLSKERLMNE